MNTYYAEIKELESDQNYYFVVKDEFGVSERFYFRTAPDTPKAFTFIAGGDTKSFEDSYLAGQASTKMVSKLGPLFVMFNGDFNSGKDLRNNMGRCNEINVVASFVLQMKHDAR